MYLTVVARRGAGAATSWLRAVELVEGGASECPPEFKYLGTGGAARGAWL